MDNYLFTGGCRYTNECEQYKNNCHNCLALKKNFKFIAINNLKFYKTILKRLNQCLCCHRTIQKNFYKSLNLNYKYKEFDFWLIQFENLIRK